MLHFGHKWITSTLPRRHGSDSEMSPTGASAASPPQSSPASPVLCTKKERSRKKRHRRSNTMPSSLLQELDLGKKWCYLYWSGHDKSVK